MKKFKFRCDKCRWWKDPYKSGYNYCCNSWHKDLGNDDELTHILLEIGCSLYEKI